MVALSKLLHGFSRRKIVVLGDLVLDQYTTGRVRRISPEAPVPVLHVQSQEFRPGGAGNVALNLVSLGNDVTLVGQVGSDWAGGQLCAALADEQIQVNGVVTNPSYVTPLKNRLIAGNQQMLRVDQEDVQPLPPEVEREVLQRLEALLEDADIVAISDYAKGFLTPSLLKHAIAAAKKRGVPVVVDPKGVDYTRYAGATVVKPNLVEATLASGLSEKAPLNQMASVLLEQTDAEHLMITRSQDGISVFSKGTVRADFPADARAVKDVTGAGDTVLATVTAALANELSIGDAAQLSNIAASLAIEELGCARITLPQLAKRLLESDARHKVFDESHISAVVEALSGRKCCVLALSGERGVSPAVFRAIHELGQEHALIVYLTDDAPQTEMIQMLSALKLVRFIVADQSGFTQFLRQVTPATAFQVSDDQLHRVDVLELLGTQTIGV